MARGIYGGPMKIGIIGAGKVGTAIAYCMRQKGVEVLAISDVSEPI